MENKKIKTIYFFLFSAAVLVKFFFLPLPGHVGDLNIHKNWGNFLINSSPTEIYNQTECNLPPFWVYVLWFSSKIHFFITGALLSVNSVALKLPAVLADIFIGLIIFWFLIKRGVKGKISFLASLFFILNPFVLYNSSVWGQLDSVYTLFALLAFIFLEHKKIYWGSFFLALSFLTKLQGAIFIPLFFFFLLKNHHWQKTVFSFFVFIFTIIFILLPFLLSGIGPLLIFQRTWLQSWHQDTYLSMNAFNLWWIPQVAIVFNTHTPELSSSFAGIINFSFWGPLSFKDVGFILFSLFYFLIFLTTQKNIFLLAGLVSFLFFMTPTAMHERYIFPFFAFFSILWALKIKYLVPYIILSLTSFLNLLFALPADKAPGVHLFNFSFLLSLVNIVVFLYLFYLLLKEKNMATPRTEARKKLM